MKKCLSLLCLFVFVFACGGSGKKNGGGNGGNATPTPTATPATPGSTGTEVIGAPGLCKAGDVARVDVNTTGAARFALVNDGVTCDTAKDNRKEEYTLILYNTSEAPMSFTMNSPINETPITTQSKARQFGKSQLLQDFVEPSAPRSSKVSPVGQTKIAKQVEQAVNYKKPKVYEYGKSPFRKSFLTRAISVNDEAEFRVRNNTSDKDSYVATSAILRAQGTHINIFVDRDVPYETGGVDALTSTQLNQVVNVYENNIYPLVTTTLGLPSDVDGDGRINVVITPVLNRDIECPTFKAVAESYFDPRNLLPYNPISNPLSNESETIFVFAPDAQKNYGLIPGAPSSVNYPQRLNAWLAFQLTHVVSYNAHVLKAEAGKAKAEDDWIDDGLGAVMADLAGFNLWRGSAKSWYLDYPQVNDLRSSSDIDCTATANYLFMLYYTYSQLNDSNDDTDGNGIDDQIGFLSKLMTSGKTGEENLENAVEFSFDEEKETEFQAIFKDWTIATATSGSERTDLQQNNQTVVKYFYNLNPTNLGSQVGDASGSVRVGAVGNDLGIDMNGVNPGSLLIENADEHVYSPGNILNGYIDPYTAMYIRVSGMFQAKQTLAIKGSSGNLKGFLVRRSDLSFPKTYNESIFGTIDQHFEDLDSAGPNPYWTGQGIAKKLDFNSLIASSAVSGRSKEFVSIVGEIDKPNSILVCPADASECASAEIPDTDKYIFTVPDLGSRTDEGALELVIRRYHADGADTSSLEPMMAVVSSKDVPYPYVPHPIRNQVNGAGTTDTRQMYRWVSNSLICGDDQASGVTGIETNTVDSCTPRDDADSPKFVFESLFPIENTGNLVTSSSSVWDGNILGGECDALPDPSKALGSNGTGYGASNVYPVTTTEVSGSPLGRYPWSSSFMTTSYAGGSYPDILFAREFMSTVPIYPPTRSSSTDPEFDPRSINSSTLNCHIQTTTDPDETPDSPDDFLEPVELFKPSSLPQQVLAEMARYRFASSGAPESTVLATQYDDFDLLSVDLDSRDTDQECIQQDFVNNMNTLTVRSGEGSLLAAGISAIEPHIVGNMDNSGIPQASQNIYNPGSSGVLTLTPGKNYTIIVGGKGSSVGNYELRIRKVTTPSISLKITGGSGDVCDEETE